MLIFFLRTLESCSLSFQCLKDKTSWARCNWFIKRPTLANSTNSRCIYRVIPSARPIRCLFVPRNLGIAQYSSTTSPVNHVIFLNNLIWILLYVCDTPFKPFISVRGLSAYYMKGKFLPVLGQFSQNTSFFAQSRKLWAKNIFGYWPI